MKNEKVILKLGDRPVNEKIEFARNIVISITGNSSLTNLASMLPAVTTAVNNLEAANIAALDGAKSKKVFLLQQEAILDNLLLQLGNNVEARANALASIGGDAKAVITSAGMDYKRDRTSASVPAAPGNVKALSTITEGDISLIWDGVHLAHVYVIEITTDPSIVGLGNRAGVPAPGITLPAAVVWTQVKILTQRRFTLTGLVSGTKYAVRIYCVGTHGESAYSNVVVAKAL